MTLRPEGHRRASQFSAVMVYRPLVVLAALLLCSLNAYAQNCQTFYSGLCPGSDTCLCTEGASCGGEEHGSLNVTEARISGGCPGSCHDVVTDRCPGSGSCLDNVGTCGSSGGGCLEPCGSPCACCGKPITSLYYLTSFDGTSCSCGACHSMGEYFSADRQRFGCGAYLHVCRGLSCVKLGVTDYGPSCFVEKDAGGSVLDASPAVCKALTNGTSCGWSDHFVVSVSMALSPEEDGRPVGPFQVTRAEMAEMLRLGETLERQVQTKKLMGGYVGPSASEESRAHVAPHVALP